MLHQKYIAKQMTVCRAYNGSSKIAMKSAEFHWHEVQWGK